jgi:hypothetical protein
MTKQLDDMWSSKWVLPEHREALIEDGRNLKRITRPELDDQEILLIDQIIHDAMKSNGTITLTIFDKHELKTVTGTVFKLDTIIKMVKIAFEEPQPDQDECEWVPLRDILKAELKETEDWDEFGWEQG